MQLDITHPITPTCTSCPFADTFSQLLQTFWSRQPLLHSASPLTVRRCECGCEGVRDARGTSESVSEGVREWPGNNHITKLLL